MHGGTIARLGGGLCEVGHVFVGHEFWTVRLRFTTASSARVRLRGLSGARDEFLLAATVQNLKTLALQIHGPPTAR
jgi:hypothetical protein